VSKEMALAVRELELAAAPIGADHAVAAAGRAQRRADERRDSEHARILGRDRRLDVV